MSVTENETAEVADAIIAAWFPSGMWCQQSNMVTFQRALHSVVTTTNSIAWDKSLDDFIKALLKLKADLENLPVSSDRNL